MRLLRPRLPRLLLGDCTWGVIAGQRAGAGGGVGLADHPRLANAAGAGSVDRGGGGPHIRDFPWRAALLRTAGQPRHRVAGRGHRPRADLLPPGARSGRRSRLDCTAASWSHESAPTSISWPTCWSAPCCRSASRPCLAIAAIVVVGVISPPAAAILAICLLVAGIVAPWLASRAAAAQEVVARQHHSARDVSAMLALEHAPELRVAGRLPQHCRRVATPTT